MKQHPIFFFKLLYFIRIGDDSTEYSIQQTQETQLLNRLNYRLAVLRSTLKMTVNMLISDQEFMFAISFLIISLTRCNKCSMG